MQPGQQNMQGQMPMQNTGQAPQPNYNQQQQTFAANPAYATQAQQPMAQPYTAQGGMNTQSQGTTNQPEQQQAPVKQDPNSTQGTLLFSELRDSMIVMKDGSFRAVVACKSINFDLMADAEREGVEMSYQDFLNSINFTIQILIRSQRIDIRPYIGKLEDLRRNEDNMLLARLMDDYIGFIDDLSQEANIMDKSFFVVIPYYSSPEEERAMTETKNFFKVMSRNKGNGISRINRDVYDKAIDEVNKRCDTVIQGLYSIGIHAVRLNTEELGHLFYSFNNPAEAGYQPLGNFNDLAQLYVRKATPEETQERIQQMAQQQGGQQ